MERLSDRKILLILFLSALIIRLAFILMLENHFYFDDEYEYYRMAGNFLAGRGLIAGEGMKGFRPPLYPLLLSVLYILRFNLVGVRIIQCVISALTVCFVYLAGRRVFSWKVGLWSGLVAAVYPFFIFYNGFLLTETLFVFLSVVSIYSFITISDGMLSSARAGAVLGLAGLCRPLMQMYFPIALLHVISGREQLALRLKKMFFITFFFVAAVSPWVARNYVVFDRFIPGTTMGGRVFWEGNNPFSDGGPCRYFPGEIEELEETDRDKVYFRSTIDVIRNDPGRFAWLLQNKFKRFWNVVPNAAEFTKPLYRFVSVISFGVMLPFFVLGFLLSVRNRKALFMHSLIIFYTVFHVIFLASIRYRISLEPFCIILAIYGFFWVIERFSGIIKGIL